MHTPSAAAGLLLLALLQVPVIHAATTLTDLPTLSSTGDTTATSSATTASSATSATSATTTDSSATPTTDSSAASTTGSSAASTTDSSSGSTFATSATTTGTSTTSSIFHLSGLPTIEGAGIPTLVIPYTADAPFMRKSSLPEGTVFIVIGSILAFLGFCVIAWRGMVAWTVNRSVRKAALDSTMASDTKRAWLSGNLKPSGGFYHAAPNGSSHNLDTLAPNGKHVSSVRYTPKADRRPVAPSNGAALFFSPTAAVNSPGAPPMSGLPANRSSSYLPAGYYAPTAGTPGTTTHGYGMRTRSAVSPPDSPGFYPPRYHTAQPGSAGGLAPPGARGTLHNYPSTSSLDVRTGAADESSSGSRAPSAYFEDLLENHGNGPRERY